MRLFLGFAMAACAVLLLVVGKEITGMIKVPKKKIIQALTGISWLLLAFSVPFAAFADFTVDLPAILGIMMCSGIVLHSILVISEKSPKDLFRRNFAFLFIVTLAVFQVFFSIFGTPANYFSIIWLALPLLGVSLARGMNSIKKSEKAFLVSPVLIVLAIFVAWIISASFNAFTFLFFFALFFAFFSTLLNVLVFRSHSEIMEAKSWILRRTAKLSLVALFFAFASLMGLGLIGLAYPGILISFVVTKERKLKRLGYMLMAGFIALAIAGI
jgi:hypothetical protein